MKEKELFALFAPDEVQVITPLKMTWDKPPSAGVDFRIHQGFGGLEIRPLDRIVRCIPPLFPGLDALLIDGWRVLIAGAIVRHDGGCLNVSRVTAGLYANRLPTNRKRKRGRAKAKRREAFGVSRGWS